MSSPDRKIKVLIVDDSAIVRKILSETIAGEPDMEVIGTAPDPYVARDKIMALHPDVLTLDIEMPRMDGLTFLKRLMRHHPIPTIIISSLGQASCTATLDALRHGAVDVLCKPSGPYSVGDLRHSLASKIRAAAASKPRAFVEPPAEKASPVASAAAVATQGSPDKLTAIPAQAVPGRQQHAPAVQTTRRIQANPGTVIAIGASTGGTVAIQDILLRLPADMPGMVITQHIPAGFSLAFANRLNKICAMNVKEAETGDIVRPGLALIAPGDYHLLLRRSGSGFVVELTQGPQVCYQRPSVDVMFASTAQVVGAHAIGVILTGMGADGARGMMALKRAGAPTIGQDEQSCVVYGMPREAARLGAVGKVAALHDIPRVLIETVQQYANLAAKAV